MTEIGSSKVQTSRSRMFWAGQSVSVVCDQGWAFIWALILVDLLRVNESWFGAANALEYVALAVIPLFVTPLFGRTNLFGIMSLLDLARMVVTLLVMAGVLLGWINLGWAILGLVVMSALAGLFQSAFYAVLPDVAGSKENLTRDNARLSVLISTGGVVMPLLAGVIAEASSPAWTMLMIGLAYGLSYVTLKIVTRSSGENDDADADDVQVDDYLLQLRRGFCVVVRDRLVGSATGLAATFNLVAGMTGTIVPVLVLKRWGLSAQFFSIYTSAATVGGILGGLVAGWIVNRVGVVRSLWCSTAAAALLFICMGMVSAMGPRGFLALIILEALVAVATVMFNVANGTLRQLVVSRDLLAQTFTTVRVVASLGSALGAALGGAVAMWGGSQVGLGIGGAIAMGGAAVAANFVRCDSRVAGGDVAETVR